MQDNSGKQIVGRVVGLWRYPVKSMALESHTEANAPWSGLAGARRWAFIRKPLQAWVRLLAGRYVDGSSLTRFTSR
ncbi:MAG: hypothetical protein AAF265_15325 [Pseudomonadota bacterium]